VRGRVCDEAGNALETHEHAGEFEECQCLVRQRRSLVQPAQIQESTGYRHVLALRRFNSFTGSTAPRFFIQHGKSMLVHGFRVCVRIANSGQPCSAEFAKRSDLTAIGFRRRGNED